MRKAVVKFVRTLGALLIGKMLAQKLIVFLYKTTDAPILKIAYNHYGVLKYESLELSGERFALSTIMKPHLSKKDVLIDVGANVGEYSELLKSHFPQSRVISIEPNPHTYELLIKKSGIEPYNYAIAEAEGELVFYTASEDKQSSQASFSVESIPNYQTAYKITVNAIRLDDLLESCAVDEIGLLKIDTEGHDLSVLKSCKSRIGKIKFIQFEFNEKYVYTRTFLKDFYSLLSATHDLFRLDSDKLHDIREYTPLNEIFRYQNILAVKKELVSKAALQYVNG